jgi:putative acetyltransferase
MIEIRSEQPADLAAIREVNRRAFGQEQEGRIVDAIRAHGAARVSLVAVDRGRIVGHILYSPASISTVTGAALGPMAVVPDAQRQRIGSRLVEAGNARLAADGCPFIVVVGHPEFYPRFGFQPASALGITCEWDVPDDAFMLLVLDRGRMRGVSGRAAFRPEFSTVE